MNDSDEKLNIEKKSVLIFVLAILTFLVAIVGATFAYYAAVINGNNTASSVLIKTSGLTIEYKAENEIKAVEVYPGWSQTMPFTITNTSKYKASAGYTLNWNIVENTFKGTDLVYKLDCNTSSSKNVCINVNQTTMPKTSSKIGGTGAVSPEAHQEYTLTVTFLDTGKDQNQNQNRQFLGKIDVKSV